MLASPDDLYYVDSALVGGFCLLIVLWATLFEETWKRRAKRLLFDWCEDDTGNNVSLNRHFRPDKREPFRPGFYTADGLWVDVDASDKAGATPLAEWSNPRWRLLHQLESCGVFLLFAAACLASIASMMLLKLYLTEFTVVIMAFNVFWRTTALGLNRRENYRLERDHRRGLVYKLFIFQFINCYFSLFYIAFIKPYGVAGMIIGISDACPIDAADAAALSEWSSADVDGSTLDDGSNTTSVVEVPTCGEELRLLLISLMLTNLLLGPLLELKRPLQMKLLTKVKAKGKRLFAMSKGKRAVQPEEAPPKAPKAGSRRGARAPGDRKRFGGEVEAALPSSLAADAEHEMWCGELIEQFERADSKSIDLGLGATFYEFNELVVQMGYIVMFSVALPSVAAFALANNLLEVRLDAFKALAVVRRPPASAARGIGSWANILHFLSILGIFINLLFLTFTIRPQWSSSLSLNERILLAVAAEHVLIAAKIALDKLAHPRRARGDAQEDGAPPVHGDARRAARLGLRPVRHSLRRLAASMAAARCEVKLTCEFVSRAAWTPAFRPLAALADAAEHRESGHVPTANDQRLGSGRRAGPPQIPSLAAHARKRSHGHRRHARLRPRRSTFVSASATSSPTTRRARC